MTQSSRMAEILRRLGQASAPPIALRKFMLSPDQSFFAFAVSSQHRGLAAELYRQLGEAEINIRLISQYRTEDGGLRVRLSLDAGSGRTASPILRTALRQIAMNSLEHVEPARILSLYPFNGRPEVPEKVFTELRRGGIEVLAAGSATSVISCVLKGSQVAQALQVLNRVVILE